jgi:hypothetical protein
MKKYMVLAVLLLAVLFSFSACTGEGYPLAVDTERIPAGVYTYYYAETGSAESATESCKQDIAVRQLMEKEGIALSANYKRIVADEADSMWSVFSAYYESIGVSKQDITQGLTAEYNKKELLDYYFGENGKKPVSADKIKKEFDKTYVGFKAIEASYLKLTDMGDSVSLSDAEKKSLKNRFEAMAKNINNGSMTINGANKSYNESIGIIVTQNPETALIKDDDVLYSDDFFEKVSELKEGQAGVIESGSSIYLIQRQNITSDEDGFVFMYRAEILEKLKMAELEKKIADVAKDMEVKINKSLCKEIEEKMV